ncbi:hypothetical protein M3626_20865 [Psychrobacillus sp. MER TA 17]|nr:hypothetical protein [Psychrobacillus sp. MER TA 17]
MAEILSGAGALDALNNDGQGGGSDKDWTKFNGGSKYVVKVIGMHDLFAFYSYGIFKQVNSFVAKNPSKKTDKGFPVDNLTPWDKAFLYHRDKSKEFGDKHSNEAYKYKPELRYALGFFDLDAGERIVIDVSKKQAQSIRTALAKYEKKIGKLAFELSKDSNGTASLTPIIDMDEDLTDKQRKNFDEAPTEFNIEEFHGILYEQDEQQMVELLAKAGFDVSLIGYSAAANDPNDEAVEISEDDVPF